MSDNEVIQEMSGHDLTSKELKSFKRDLMAFSIRCQNAGPRSLCLGAKHDRQRLWLKIYDKMKARGER